MKSTRLFLAALAAFAAGCRDTIPERSVDAAKSRQDLETALQSGSKVYTIYLRSGLRWVVTNLELEAGQYCYKLLAERSESSFADYWKNYDRFDGQPERDCMPYVGIVQVETKDARK